MPRPSSARPRRPGQGRRLRLELFEDRLAPAAVTFQLVNDWGAGFTGTVRITNDESAPIDGWRLEFNFTHQLTQVWNGVLVGHSGDHYVIDDAGYNRTIPPGQAVEFGFNGMPGNVTGEPTNYILNGVPVGGGGGRTVSVNSTSVTEGDTSPVTAAFAVTLSAVATAPVTVRYATANAEAQAGVDYQAVSGTLTLEPGETSQIIDVSVLGDVLDETNEAFTLTLSNPVGAALGTARAVGTIVDNDPEPTLSVSDTTATEPAGTAMAPGFLHTSGNQIVDAAGRAVRLSGVSWFGMEGTTFSPHGLWARSYRDMMDQVRDLGFNHIRLPFSSQLFDPGSTPNGIDFARNPDLQGLSGLQILDKVVDYAGQIGLRIILDHHRSDAGAGAQGNGLWYTSSYPESRWIADWRMLAERYAGNPTVIGADLHNEPHGPATWGGGGTTDWRLAAERAGNVVLAVNPDWLILVEGVETTAAGSTWWGGNLANAGALPVRLNVPGRLVYSPHDYPASIFPQPWFSAPDYPQNLYGVWDQYWGHLFRQGIAPVLVGEFGSKLETTSDRQWADAITTYLGGDLDGNGTNDLGPGQQGPSWTWWSWNPNSGDTGGILQDDWVHVHEAKLDQLEPVQFTTGGPALATFTVSLNAPSGRTVLVDYATADGTATAGADYTAVSGTLEFRPGETTRTVSVPVLADELSEPAEGFTLRLSSPRFATLADPDGVGTIQDASSPSPPTVHAGDVRVTEGDTGTTDATFTVTLSAPSAQPVTVEYATADGTAVADGDYLSRSGTLTFAPGVTTQTVSVPVVGDRTAEPTETFRLVLSNPTNAVLGPGPATGTIVDNDGAGIRVEFTVRDDWGAGFVADMSITNERARAIDGWTLEFDFDREITNIWNARIVSHVGSHYVIRNETWNPVIRANGGRVEFGFQGAPGNVTSGPRDYVLNGERLP